MKKLFFVLVGAALVFANCGSSSNSLSGASTIVGSVETNMIPASLSYTSASSSAINISAGAPTENPCTEFNTVYGAASVGACEPKLIRLYLEMVKEFMTNTKTFMDTIGGNLGNPADGSTGTAAGPGGMEIDYSKTDSTHYSVLMKVSGVSAGYINVAGTIITVKLNFATLGTVDSSITANNAIGNLDGTINYTDDNNYTVNITISDMPCNAETDISAPKNINVIVTKTAGLWKGYSMLYHPRFGREDRTGYTCATTEDENTSRLIYTNFVGDATTAKANVYMMKRTLTDVTALTTSYGLNQICGTDSTIFSDACGYSTTLMATFINPFCNPASTLTATWGDSCASDATVSAEAFPTDAWIAPSTFYTVETTFSLPTAL